MTNRSRTLYIGITGESRLRVFQHKTGVLKGFTSRYKVDRLVSSMNPTWQEPG